MAIEIDTDPARLDLPLIHEFLSTKAYWAVGRPLGHVQRAIANSLNFGAYQDGRQVGFTRVVTDRATFAWVCDVFVLESHRGQGISKRMMESVVAHPELLGLRRILLATRDAHELYRRYGFRELPQPGRWMAIENL
jgi:GNAT superfamily N-acetyltransferase